jgi:hypothetical protein
VSDGTVTDGPQSKANIGGFSVVEAASREHALKWLPRLPSPALKNVREFLPDPAVGN